MKIKMLAGTGGCSGGDCPEVYATDRGTVVVRGYKITDPGGAAAIDSLDMPANESAVEVPLDLLRRAVTHAG